MIEYFGLFSTVMTFAPKRIAVHSDSMMIAHCGCKVGGGQEVSIAERICLPAPEASPCRPLKDFAGQMPPFWIR